MLPFIGDRLQPIESQILSSDFISSSISGSAVIEKSDLPYSAHEDPISVFEVHGLEKHTISVIATFSFGYATFCIAESCHWSAVNLTVAPASTICAPFLT